MINVSPFLVILIQYSQRHSVINHCDKCITLLSDTDISFSLFNLFILICLLGNSNTLKVKQIMKIYLIEQKIFPNHKKRVIRLSQWFITLCLWLYCTMYSIVIVGTRAKGCHIHWDKLKQTIKTKLLWFIFLIYISCH